MSTVIRAARLVDGTGGPAVDDPVVFVDGGRIVAVRQGSADGLPADAERLDFPGGTLLPGLTDAHVHLNLPGDGTVFERWAEEDDGVFVAAAAHAAREALLSGVTTVRDTGSRRGTAFSLRRAVTLGRGLAPRLLLCGPPVTITGGHTWPMGGEADGVEGVRRRVRELCKQGADWIKVIGSGGGTAGTLVHRPAFTREELTAIAEEAHRLDRRVTVHTVNAASLEDAIDAGVDGIEHALFLVDNSHQEYAPRVAEKLAASGIPVTSTMVVGHDIVAAVDKMADPDADHRDQRERWTRMLDDTLDQFAKLRSVGVDFISGTDAGWRFTGFTRIPDELWLMTQAGMTAAEAIHSSTGRAADVLGIAGETGRVKPGLAADLLVVGGDPLADVRALNDVRMVMRAGARVA